jgi:hypothetical protein
VEKKERQQFNMPKSERREKSEKHQLGVKKNYADVKVGNIIPNNKSTQIVMI